MRILLLSHAFNSLTQRLYVELTDLGHEVSVEFDINDSVTVEAVDLFRPHLILAPYLRRAIPEAIWRGHVCLIVHPGIVGDRGPSALDWAILNGETEWGVTVLQAEAALDAGPVWAAETFPMRAATKSSLYRNEITEAVVRAVRAALERLPDYSAGRWQPRPAVAWPGRRGRQRPLARQADRAIQWDSDDTASVLRKLRSADGSPGVLDRLFGRDCLLYDAHAAADAAGVGGRPGELLARSGGAVLRATSDGAVWIGRARRPDADIPIKLPVTVAFPEALELPEFAGTGPDPIRYEETDGVGWLHFDFYNGAMGTEACGRLLAAYQQARARPTRVIVLMGGADFFSNGLDLNLIEAAESPPDESWRNINAMDDLCQAILTTDGQLTVSALRGNAGAGGAFLALAADQVWARAGVVLNPHYKNMGNLYGSEFWTYTLAKRVGEAAAREIMRHRLPMGAAEALRRGFIQNCLGSAPEVFAEEVRRHAIALARAPDFASRLAAKGARRAADEAAKPLASYRQEELEHMRRNFYGFDPSYHVARHHFAHKVPHSWTPRHLARHRELGWRVVTD